MTAAAALVFAAVLGQPNGSIEYAGPVRVVNLWGSWGDMGYAEGYLLGPEIMDLYEVYLVELAGGTGGVESAFALFYGPVFGTAASAGYLVWRVITFFAPTFLAVPMLSLRSNHPESLYQRWNNLVHGAYRRQAALNMKHAQRSATRAARSATRVAKKAGKGASAMGQGFMDGYHNATQKDDANEKRNAS